MTQRAFITGASGHIGSHVARALIDHGWQVHGLTRHSTGAGRLRSAGIEPVIGRMDEPEGWQEAARSADLLVHAAADYSADTYGLDRQATLALLAVRKETGARFIYTSGVWMAGHANGRILTEQDNAGIERIAARREIEPLVMNAGGIVLRPGVVYGERAGLTAPWFAGDPVVGDGSNHWAMVNVQDLAQGYVLAAEKSVDGDIFHLVDDSHLTVAEMVSAARRVAGIDEAIEWIPYAEAVTRIGNAAEALALNQLVANDKARKLLGWQPQAPDFVAGAQRYFNEWRAVNAAAA